MLLALESSLLYVGSATAMQVGRVCMLNGVCAMRPALLTAFQAALCCCPVGLAGLGRGQRAVPSPWGNSRGRPAHAPCARPPARPPAPPPPAVVRVEAGGEPHQPLLWPAPGLHCGAHRAYSGFHGHQDPPPGKGGLWRRWGGNGIDSWGGGGAGGLRPGGSREVVQGATLVVGPWCARHRREAHELLSVAAPLPPPPRPTGPAYLPPSPLSAYQLLPATMPRCTERRWLASCLLPGPSQPLSLINGGLAGRGRPAGPADSLRPTTQCWVELHQRSCKGRGAPGARCRA